LSVRFIVFSVTFVVFSVGFLALQILQKIPHT
jgi:hypothetical protein